MSEYYNWLSFIKTSTVASNSSEILSKNNKWIKIFSLFLLFFYFSLNKKSTTKKKRFVSIYLNVRVENLKKNKLIRFEMKKKKSSSTRSETIVTLKFWPKPKMKRLSVCFRHQENRKAKWKRSFFLFLFDFRFRSRCGQKGKTKYKYCVVEKEWQMIKTRKEFFCSKNTRWNFLKSKWIWSSESEVFAFVVRHETRLSVDFSFWFFIHCLENIHLEDEEEKSQFQL